MTAATPQPPDLSHERAQVLAQVAGSPMSPNPPSVRAAAPLRSLSPALEAKLGDAAVLPSRPAAGVRRRVVVPSATLALLDLLGVVVAAATGHVALAIVAGVLFLPLAALAVMGARFGRSPVRLTVADRMAVAQASRWDSRQHWTGPLATSDERGLVFAAARTVERIAGSPSWRSGRLDEMRVRLDLATELDEIDEQAYRIAVARQGVGPVEAETVPAIDLAYDALLNRVAALTAYANELDGYARRRREELARQGDPVRDSDLLAGSVRDEFAFDQLLALTFYLTANRNDS